MKGKKNLYSVIFLVLVIGFTWYAIFSKNDLSDIIVWISRVKFEYIVLAMLLVPIFVCCESLIITYLMKQFGEKVPIRRSCIYSFVGFFYSCITPSASGGQPAQLYYMKKDNYDISECSIVLIIVTIGYKLVLVLFGGYILLFHRTWMHHILGKGSVLCYLGMLLNIICILTMFIFIFSKKIVPFLIDRCERICVHIRLFRKSEQRRAKIEKAIERYQSASDFLKQKKNVWIPVVVISIVQRLILFFTTYLVYLGFGLKGSRMLSIIVLQALIALSVDMLPLPGGMGVSEGLFVQAFQSIFGQVFVVPAMLLSRWISFYSLLLISGIITLVIYIRCRKQANY